MALRACLRRLAAGCRPTGYLAAYQLVRKPISRLILSGLALGGGLYFVNGRQLVYAAESNQSSEADVDKDSFMAAPLTDLAVLQNSDRMRHRMELFITKIQKDICTQLEQLEGSGTKFHIDRWLRKEGGGGITCIMEEGTVFERAGVNISVVHGTLGPQAVKEMNSTGRRLPEGRSLPFFATGISSVIHPRNPNVPTIHFNYRYFEVEEEPGKLQWWFGGGTDLTPYYLDDEDAKHFHKTLKDACDPHDTEYYPRFKKWCDEYFFLRHRGETRGVGGIFFDDVIGSSPETAFSFVKSCANAILPAYVPIVQKQKDAPYGYREREWQLLRRGRYVEFNLVYDRGTKFGLYTPGARIESILMSLPVVSKWKYCHTPDKGSPEDRLWQVLKEPKEWV